MREVVDNAIGFLERRDLFNVLTTSSSLGDSARKALYRSMDVSGLLCLITRTLASQRWQVSTHPLLLNTDGLTFSSFSSNKASLFTKRERFHLYTKHIRELVISFLELGGTKGVRSTGDAFVYSEAANRAFEKLRMAADLFPNDGAIPHLRTLVVRFYCSEDLRQILPFVRPPLERLTLAWLQGPDLPVTTTVSALMSVGLALPSALTSLSLTGKWKINPFAVVVSEDHPPLLPSRLVSLRGLNCAATAGLLSQVTQLQALRLLAIRLNPGTLPINDPPAALFDLPALRTLQLSGDPHSIGLFFSRCPSSPLLEAHIDTSLHSTLLPNLIKPLSHRTLQHISLKLALLDSNPDDPPIDVWHALHQLAGCSRIRTFGVVVSQKDPVHLTPTTAFIQHVAPSWPILRNLHILYGTATEAALQPSAPALLALATHCPGLKDVSFSSIHLSDPLPPPPPETGHPNPIVFSFKFPSSKPVMLSAFLSALWPEVEVAGEEGSEWRVVDEALRALRWQKGSTLR